MLDKKLLEILCCPKCKGELYYDEVNQKLNCKFLPVEISYQGWYSYHANR